MSGPSGEPGTPTDGLDGQFRLRWEKGRSHGRWHDDSDDLPDGPAPTIVLDKEYRLVASTDGLEALALAVEDSVRIGKWTTIRLVNPAHRPLEAAYKALTKLKTLTSEQQLAFRKLRVQIERVKYYDGFLKRGLPLLFDDGLRDDWMVAYPPEAVSAMLAHWVARCRSGSLTTSRLMIMRVRPQIKVLVDLSSDEMDALRRKAVEDGILSLAREGRAFAQQLATKVATCSNEEVIHDYCGRCATDLPRIIRSRLFADALFAVMNEVLGSGASAQPLSASGHIRTLMAASDWVFYDDN